MQFSCYFLQTKAEMEGLVGSSCQIHHLSPGSVLEASFSSSSLDESPGKKKERERRQKKVKLHSREC